jgi:hypothetical protein
MDLKQALTADILSILPADGLCKSVIEITQSVAPLREKEVRAVIRDLVKRGLLDVVPAGNFHLALYRQKPAPRSNLKQSCDAARPLKARSAPPT